MPPEMQETQVKLEHYRPLIEKALAHTGGAWTWDALAEEVNSGRAFLLPSKSGKSVVVMQAVRDLHIFTASGDLEELMEMEADVAVMASASGYDRMTLIGRGGWKRVLKSRGWKPESGLVKEL